MRVWVRRVLRQTVPFLLCLSVMAGSFSAMAAAGGADRMLAGIAVFKEIKLCHAGVDGALVGEPVEENELLDQGKDLMLYYTYEIPGDKIKQVEPDVPYYLNVSPHLALSKLDSGSPLTMETENGPEQFGVLYSDGSRAWVEFDGKPDGSGAVLSDYDELANAYFYLNCARAAAPPQGELPVAGSGHLYVMKFEDGGQQAFGYAELMPVETKAQIQKGGNLRDKTITWTIRYTPWQNPSAADGVDMTTPFELRDTIDTTLHSFIPGSVRIDGSPVLAITSRDDISDTLDAYVLVEDTGNDSTVLSLGGTKFRAGTATQGNPPQALTITYETVIRDRLLLPGAGAGNHVSNKAELFAGTDAGAANLGIDASSSVPVPQPVWLEKTGTTDRHTDGTGSTTDWTVTFYPNGFFFQDDAQLTLWDQLPDGSTLVDGSMLVDGVPASAAATGKNGFSVAGIKTGGQPVKITYQTHVPEEMYDSGTNLGKNTAWFTFRYNGADYTTPAAETPVGSGDGSGTPGTALLVKSNSGYDSAMRSISWNVTINPHKVNLKSGTFTDDLGEALTGCGISGHDEGLELEGGTDGVTVALDGKPVLPDDPVSLAYDSQKLTITVGDIGPKTITLTYTTKVCDPCIFANNTAKKIAVNTISTDNMRIGTSGLPRSAKAQSSAEISATVLKKLPPVYDYSAGIMKWTVEVDAAGLAMSDIVLTDVLPDGLTYVPDSLDTEPQIQAATADASGQTLTIRLGSVAEKTTVTFETVVSPERLGFDRDTSVVVENMVHMNGNADQVRFTEVSHKVEQTFYNHGLLKSSGVDQRQELIRYEVLINPYGLLLPGNPTLVDTLDPRLSLDTDTLRLYRANVSGTTAGTGQKPVYSKAGAGQPLTVSSCDPATNSFAVRLPIDAGSRDAYVLTYTADIIDMQKDSYCNSIRFEGGAVLLGGEKENQASVGGGGGGGGGGVAGRRARIAVTKRDSVDQAPLAGVTFTLYQWDAANQARGLPFAQGTTDAQGMVSFLVKPDAVYELVETESRPGYGSIIGCAQLPGGVSRTDTGLLVTAGKAGSLLQLDLTNEALTTDLVFRMMNQSGIPMNGSEMILYDRDPDGPGNPDPLKESIVMADGTVLFSGVRRGAVYYIRKPDGGVIMVEIPADISESPVVKLADGTEQKLTADYQVTGSVPGDQQWELVITKKETGDTTPLQGAVFGLYAEESVRTQLKTGVSGPDGSVSFSGLMKGQEYWIREVTAPDGYILDAAVYMAGETDPAITIYNQPKPPEESGVPGLPDGAKDPDSFGPPGSADSPGPSGSAGSSTGSGSHGEPLAEETAFGTKTQAGGDPAGDSGHPQTGDDGITGQVALFLASGLILAILIRRAGKRE